jgi:hypothetical protein
MSSPLILDYRKFSGPKGPYAWKAYSGKISREKVRTIPWQQISEMRLPLAAECAPRFILFLTEKQFAAWTPDQLKTWQKRQLQTITKDQFKTLQDPQINAFTWAQAGDFAISQYGYFFPYFVRALNIHTLKSITDYRFPEVNELSPLSVSFLATFPWPYKGPKEFHNGFFDLANLKLMGGSENRICDGFFGDMSQDWKKGEVICATRDEIFTNPSPSRDQFDEENARMREASGLEWNARLGAYMKLLRDSDKLLSTYYINRSKSCILNCYEIAAKMIAADMSVNGFSLDQIHKNFQKNGVEILFNNAHATFPLDGFTLADLRILSVG